MVELLDLKNEKVILEIRTLVDEINTINNGVDVYCDLMKQLFLSGSNKN